MHTTSNVKKQCTSQECLWPATKSLISSTYYSHLDASPAPGTTCNGSDSVFKVIYDV
jgi:hypothetical protein